MKHTAKIPLSPLNKGDTGWIFYNLKLGGSEAKQDAPH